MSAAASTSALPSSSRTPPNTALYVKNIPSAIKKDELRRQLFALFITYGRVLDVVATRRAGMRGQAFVVFEDLAGATAALRSLDGFSFYGQPIALEYARTKARATVVQEFGPEAAYNPALMQQHTKPAQKVTISTAGADLQGRERKRAREEAGQRGEVLPAAESDHEETQAGAADGPPDQKRRKSETVNGNGRADGSGGEEAESSEGED